MIDIRELEKTFHLGNHDVHALRSITLHIEGGECIAVLGPSGSGKSTLMHLIGGLDTPTSGLITVDGLDLSSLPPVELARFRNEKVGFVFQSFHLQPHLSAIENVALPLKIRGVPKRERHGIAEARLEEVGLADRVLHKPSELSGGQCQRVSIARALAGEPRLLLADEPTGNVDSKTGNEIVDLFLDLNRNRNLTAIVVTHDGEIATRMHRSIKLRDGRIVDSDSPIPGASHAGAGDAPCEAP